MKNLIKIVINLAYPDPKEPEHVLQRSDYFAMVVIAIIVAVVAWFWPG